VRTSLKIYRVVPIRAQDVAQPMMNFDLKILGRILFAIYRQAPFIRKKLDPVCIRFEIALLMTQQ